MTNNIKGLLEVLKKSINEAILESNDVAAAMAVLKRNGLCPLFMIDISLQEEVAAAPVEARGREEELVLGDADVEFLAAVGITDPSWCSTCRSGTA